MESRAQSAHGGAHVEAPPHRAFHALAKGKVVSAREAVRLIRDGDTVYVTEAPFTQFSKVLGAITGTASSADAVTSIGGS